MFGIEPTPLDLRLITFRIPVRVHPSFWIAGALMSWEADHLEITFVWVMCLFVSILIHELGHALTSEAFGWPSEILLYWCGGLAFSQREYNRTPLREMAVALAGPFAGFGLFGLTMFVLYVLRLLKVEVHDIAWTIFTFLIYINLFWGMVNLLPVLPLDGGRVCQALLQMLRLRDPLRASMQVSVLVSAGAAAIFFYVLDMRFAGFLFVILCVQNIAGLSDARSSRY